MAEDTATKTLIKALKTNRDETVTHLEEIIEDNTQITIIDTIFARALDANGALISGIPFQFSISEDVGGYPGLTLSEINSSIYLSVGGLSVSD